MGINASNQVSGLFGDSSGTHGFIRGANGLGYTTIDVPGSSGTVASGINDAGVVAGYYRLGRNFISFVRSLDGILTSFDAPGSNFTKATGVNDAGEIAGASSSTRAVPTDSPVVPTALTSRRSMCRGVR